MGKRAFDQKALTRLKTRSGAGAHRDRRQKRQKDRLRREMEAEARPGLDVDQVRAAARVKAAKRKVEEVEAAWHHLRRGEPA